MRIIHLLTAVVLAALALPAEAAPTVNLSVTGTLVPRVCDVNFGGGGILNFGKFSAATLNSTQNTHLGKNGVPLTILCDAPTRFSMTIHDLRAGTETSSSRFGAGQTDAGENIGYLTIGMHEQIPGFYATTSSNGGTTWNPSTPNGPILANNNAMQRFGWNTTSGSTAGPSAIESISGDLLNVDLYITRADSLTLTSDVVVDGLVTLELSYL